MIGPLEVLILLAILLVIFGAKYLPQLGRSAGKGVKVGSEKGKELAAVAQEKAKDVDTKAIARQAGDHMREAREFRDVLKGDSKTAQPADQPQQPVAAPAAAASTEVAQEARPAPEPVPEEKPAPDPASEPAAEAEQGGAGSGDSAPSDSGSDSGASDSGSSSSA